MPAGDLERFEAAAGDLLEELGYPRAARTRQRRSWLGQHGDPRLLYQRGLRLGETATEGWER